MRALLLRLSESKRLAPLMMHNGASRRVARRFVAGETLDDAVEAAREVNRRLQLASLDLLGENVSDEAGAGRAAEGYLAVFDRIAQERLDANVSLKLTQLGLHLSEDLCLERLEKIVAHATSQGNFVRIDMEGSAYRQQTLDFVHQLHGLTGNRGCVGAVIQSYMRSAQQDVEKLLADGIRIRLCKGAYKEPPDLAFQQKAEVDANYVKLMKVLLKSGIYHGLATHDETIIDQAKSFAAREQISRDGFEFQMLYGIRRDLQQRLVREGWRMRVYIPFGTEWYPYFMRRLAERPANVLFVAKNLLRN